MARTGCFIPRYACFNIWFHNGKDRLFYVHFLSSEAPLYICLLLAHKAVGSIAPLPQVNLRLPQVTSVTSVVFGNCPSMLVAWPFCLFLLFHVSFCFEAFVCFCLVSWETSLVLLGLGWVWVVVCFLLVSGFWLLRLVIPTGAAVTVAELFLNSVQQCSFILLLKCCFCLAVVGGFVFSCGTVVSVLAARSLHFCCSTPREEHSEGYLGPWGTHRGWIVSLKRPCSAP